LNLACDKLLHLGRGLGAKILVELLEVETDGIQRMGNWNLGVYDNSYSGKIPLKPIQKLASGFTNLYYLGRSEVEPPANLLRMIPIGGWCYDALAPAVKENIEDHYTAFEVLKFFCDLNKITLQDAAAPVALNPERRNHMFYPISVFQLDSFIVSFCGWLTCCFLVSLSPPFLL
jgi:hypothetical protein